MNLTELERMSRQQHVFELVFVTATSTMGENAICKELIQREQESDAIGEEN